MRGTIVLKAGAMKRKSAPELSLDQFLGNLPDLPGLNFDFAELDELLGLGDLPDLPLDLPAIRSRDPGESPKNARTRVVGSGGEGARKSKPVCGAKTRKGTLCKAPGNGKGGRCKLHGGMSTGPRTPEGKTRSLAALRSRHARRRSNNCRKTGPSPLKQQRRNSGVAF